MSRKRSRNRSRVTDRPPASVNDSADSDQSDSLRPPRVETTSTPPPVQAAEEETSSPAESPAATAEPTPDKPAQGPGAAPKPPPHLVLTKKSFFDVPESVTSSPAPRSQTTKQAPPPSAKPAPTELAQHEQKQPAQQPVEHKAEKPSAPEEAKAQQPATPPASDKAEPAVDDLEIAAKAKEQSSIATAVAAEDEDFTPAVSEHAKSWPPAAPEEKKEQTLRGFPEAPASQKPAESAPQKATAESVEVQAKGSKAAPLDRTAPGIGPAPDLRPQPPAEPQKQKRSETTPQAKSKSAGDKGAENKKKKKLVESGKHEAIQEEFFARGEAVSSENLAKFAEVSAQHEAVLEATPPASPLSPEQIERRRRLRRVVLMVVVGALSLALVGAYKLKLQKAAETESRASARPSTALASATPPPSQHRVPVAPPPVSLAPTAQESASAEPVASASASAAPSASVAASAAPSSSAVAAASTLPDGVNPKKEAERLLNIGRYKDAIRMAEAAIELDPEDAYPYLYLGAALQSSGRWKDGIAAYSKCVHTAKKGPIAECRAVGGH